MTIRNPSKDPALLLKSTPPRIGRSFLDRERLELSHFERSSTQVTALLAPTGFGKTSQLASWRREVENTRVGGSPLKGTWPRDERGT